jgi:hypothetical protein
MDADVFGAKIANLVYVRPSTGWKVKMDATGVRRADGFARVCSAFAPGRRLVHCFEWLLVPL